MRELAHRLPVSVLAVLWLVATHISACACGSAGNSDGTAEAPNPLESADVAKASQSGPQAGQAPEPDGQGLVRLLVPGAEPRVVKVEVVYTPAGRQLGLMHRRSMAADAGMLFLFPREQQLSFWMKNTHLPLDMVFIRGDLSVLGVVENAEPHTLTSRRVPGVSQFVLEVNAGYARRFGIVEGTRVEFVGVEDERAALRN